MKIKKTVVLFLAALFLVLGLSGCGGEKEASGKLKIVTTIFPVYDWTKNIVGNQNAEITLLVDGTVDLHSFSPTAADIRRISLCDVFIYIGGESDAWVTDAVRQAENGEMIVINLIEALGDAAKIEEEIEGAGHEEDAEGSLRRTYLAFS